MEYLTNKRIVLGLTGSIAAYKGAELVRRLKEAGADVQVIMTEAAGEFITPLTMQALSGRPVRRTFLDTEAEAAMGHIELARWADLVLVAPASANFLSRLARGEASDLLTAVGLAADSKLAVAPAMNRQMWMNPATQDNVVTLRERGIHVFGPESGDQACGETGFGRLREPVQLVEDVAALFDRGVLQGQRVIVTAGPTREDIDPVRYLSNRSSGKMGYALATAALEAGARVTLISGPVSLSAPERIARVDVVSAGEMYDAVMARIAECDIFIGAAAVSDYRPVDVLSHKIKKHDNKRLSLELEPTADIIAAVAARDGAPYTVGFAAESGNVEEYARRKLRDKRLDLVAANDISDRQLGFDSDENALTLFWEGGRKVLAQAPKTQLARTLIQLIAERYHEKNPA